MNKQVNKEEIIDIKGYEGIYKISNTGRVISYPKRWVGGKGSIRNQKEIELRISNDRKGYKIIGLRKFGIMKTHKVHRLVAEAFIPNFESKPQVNHKDGNKTNNNVGNLEWATHLENMQHASKNGLRNFMIGEKHGRSKLSTSNIIEIFDSNLSDVELSDKYKVSRSHIYLIKTGKKWKHITSKLQMS